MPDEHPVRRMCVADSDKSTADAARFCMLDRHRKRRPVGDVASITSLVDAAVEFLPAISGGELEQVDALAERRPSSVRPRVAVVLPGHDFQIGNEMCRCQRSGHVFTKQACRFVRAPCAWRSFTEVQHTDAKPAQHML